MNTTTTNTHRLLGALAGTLLLGTLAACGNEGAPAAPGERGPEAGVLQQEYDVPFPGCRLTADQLERVLARKSQPQCIGYGTPRGERPDALPHRVPGHL